MIVSNDAANLHLNRVQVIPLTSNVDKLYPSEAYVTFEGKKAKAMADQLTTVSKTRMSKRSGIITKQELQDLSRAIKIQLDL